ncbi:MAG: glycosyltransferase family 4 protein [Acidimicrobiales bacterium]|nr:glycosyltransferase family 4 protein [Actinomycetota bacterium]
MTSGSRILLDCRWLNIGGAGRLTELLAQGLAELRPPGTWVLWGPPGVETLAWAGSEVVLTSIDPRSAFGQRSWSRIPPNDLAVFMHQKRPLRPIPSVTVVLDTIPLRFAHGAVDRRSKELFLRAVGRLSRRVITISEYSRRCIERDLGVAADRISVVRLPLDWDLAERVHRLRADVKAQDVAIYVGNFGSHKNLPRLIEAFGRAAFSRTGGRLLLVGGSLGEVQELASRLTQRERSMVELSPMCTRRQLEVHYAGALFLVQPSLEEGFGLPVWEALACGLPVCVSDGGALPEVAKGLVEPFSATSVLAMAEALDACAERARDLQAAGGPSPSEDLHRTAPDSKAFAQQFVAIVEQALA